LASESVGDYLKVIYSKLKDDGYARTSDISSVLGVQPPSVTEMLQKLHRNKLLKNFSQF
jgi:Mn-dependent DtxR family transcriptional regulator